MTFAKVKNSDGLVRDMTSGAILDTNTTKYEKHLAERERQLRVINERNRLQSEINILKQEMSEIKSILKELVRNRNTE